jgi:hypothetical protein
MQCLKSALPSNTPLILCISFLFPQFSAASLVLASLASLGATQPLIAAALAVRCCARCWRQRRQSARFGICVWTACLIYQRQSQSHSLSSLFLFVRYSPSVFPSEILFSSLSSYLLRFFPAKISTTHSRLPSSNTFAPLDSTRSHPRHELPDVSNAPSMKETSSSSDSYIDRFRSWAASKANGHSPPSNDSSRSPTLPLSNPDTHENSTTSSPAQQNAISNGYVPSPRNLKNHTRQVAHATANHVPEKTSSDNPPPAPPPQADGEGAVVESEKPQRKNVAMRFYITARSIILSSYINILLLVVPVAIAAKAAGLKPGIVFALNAIAIIPLAGLLSHATESVAKRMGDTIGALMNVTFGNAVELIILYVVLPHLLYSSANVLQHVCLPDRRSRQERARSPLKGHYHINRVPYHGPSFPFSPLSTPSPPFVRAACDFTRPMLTPFLF